MEDLSNGLPTESCHSTLDSASGIVLVELEYYKSLPAALAEPSNVACVPRTAVYPRKLCGPQPSLKAHIVCGNYTRFLHPPTHGAGEARLESKK